MKILILLMCVSYLLPVQCGDTDRYAYCESCLTAAHEIEETMKSVPAESRQIVVDILISGGVCKKLPPNKHDFNINDKLMSSCIHLFDSHHDKFNAALMNKEPKNLDIVLCYEQSTACVGVKRQSFQDSKATFMESDIDALLQENKENLRIADPVRSGSAEHSKNEL